MWSRKTFRLWRIGLIAFSAMIIILIVMTGCSNEPQKVEDPPMNTSKSQMVEKNNQVEEKYNHVDAESIAAIYRDIYEEAVDANTSGSLEVVRSIVNQLGKNGYAAVDSENQINMTCAEKVLKFCKQVDAKEEAEVTIIEVSYLGGFTKYDLRTESGKVDVDEEYYQYENGNLKSISTSSYTTDSWQYTEDGYLLFEGSWYSDEYYIITLSEAKEHIALRVQPLDERCRELNQQYIRPIGYKQNNMFLIDWNEEDFGKLDFYDLYDAFYPIVNKQFVPYGADDNLGVGATYLIPKEQFESVTMEYINIDSETLQLKATYFPEDLTYEYRTRGFYEVENPNIPYPEVVDYEENSDGTITLIVNAVYPNENISKLFVHEVAIRPLYDGHYQYVSNRVISSEDNYGMLWHTDRLSKEEWEELYGETE